MGAVFAGAANAPLTSVLILFEMTRDYEIILPLSLAVAFSTVVARLLNSETIYTLKLKRRNIDLTALENMDLMHRIRVKDAMTPLSKVIAVDQGMTFDRLSALFLEHHSHGFAVLENGNDFVGVVTLSDLERSVRSGAVKKTVGEICTRDVRFVFPDQTLTEAMSYFGTLDVGRIPVLARGERKQLVGMLGRGDIIRTLSRVVVQNERPNAENGPAPSPG